jgi:lipid-A-disaccharide synthase
VPVSFVGHPLVDLVRPAADRAAFLGEIGCDPGRPVVAVLPGSRPKEVGYNLPPLVEAARRLATARPELQVLLALAPTLDRRAIEAAIVGSPLRVVPGRTHAVVASAALALVASGTATVETALLGTPMVVVYRIASLSYLLGRPFVRVPHYAMVNLIAGERLVPELIQAEFTPERVVAEALSLLDDAGRRGAMRRGLSEVRRRLGEPGASRRAAREVAALLAAPGA